MVDAVEGTALQVLGGAGVIERGGEGKAVGGGECEGGGEYGEGERECFGGGD